MVERERAIAESDAKHLLWNLISVLDTDNSTVYCTVIVGCKLQIFHVWCNASHSHQPTPPTEHRNALNLND
jgi:hypothetical protein